MCEENKELRLNVLSIDAWKEDGGWTWNDWRKVASIPLEALHWKPRKIIGYLRNDLGLLSDASKGKVSVFDDQFNLIVVEKATNRPLYAIEYGQHV